LLFPLEIHSWQMSEASLGTETIFFCPQDKPQTDTSRGMWGMMGLRGTLLVWSRGWDWGGRGGTGVSSQCWGWRGEGAGRMGHSANVEKVEGQRHPPSEGWNVIGGGVCEGWGCSLSMGVQGRRNLQPKDRTSCPVTTPSSLTASWPPDGLGPG
jgi:hypothetical protein